MMTPDEEGELRFKLAAAEQEIKRLRERLRIANVAQLLEPLYQLFNRLCRRELPRISSSEAQRARLEWLANRDWIMRTQARQQELALRPPLIPDKSTESPSGDL